MKEGEHILFGENNIEKGVSSVSEENRISFFNYLPSVFGTDKVENVNYLKLFLQSFEDFFEGLQMEIEGMPGGTEGGIPSLFYPDPNVCTYFQYYKGYDQDGVASKENFLIEYLTFIAEWIGIPLREDKNAEWNHEFLNAVIDLQGQKDSAIRRGTLEGMQTLLDMWLSDERLEQHISVELKDFISDKKPAYEFSDNRQTNEEQYSFSLTFNVGKMDLTHDITEYKKLKRKIQYLLNMEKPAHTRYKILLENTGIKVAPNNYVDKSNPGKYAQIKPRDSKTQFLQLFKRWYVDTESE